MTGLQLAIVSGALMLGGVAVLLVRFVPAHTHLRDALDRLHPVTVDVAQPSDLDRESRLGDWAARHLPAWIWGTPPDKDLAILGRTRASFYGSKIISAFLGLLIGPLIAVVTGIFHLPLPFMLPVIGSLGLAAMLWFLPNQELRDKARKAREEFTFGLGSFVEMVALERLAGATVPQALLRAADTGDSRVFERLATTLRRTRYTGRSEWDALEELGDTLGVPDLADLADLMRLAGADGTRVYDSLRSRAAAMRNAALNAHVTRANAASERIAVPVGLLVFVLAATLVTPAFLRML